MSKLKNILFEEIEEEEVEKPKKEETIEPKVSKKEESVDRFDEPVKKVKEKNNDDIDKLSDRELFKTDSTFNFPAFDEEEFNKTMPRSSRSTNVLDYEKRKAETRKHDIRRPERVEVDRDKKKFKPSPIISPVYGILDKDYTPDDILPRQKNEDKKNNTGLDVDSVRKKAFGTLEEDIKETVIEPEVTYYEEPEEIKAEKEEQALKQELEEKVKTIDELLEDSATEEIVVPENNDDNIEEIEEELDKLEDDDSLAILDGIDDVEPNPEENTLENDLFDLIDSMYEKKEDE